MLIDVAWGPGSYSLQEDERHLPDHGDVSQVQAASLHLETSRALPVGHRSSSVQGRDKSETETVQIRRVR